MICFPNAKINLGLNIISKRPDGYHNIETVFYPVLLNDVLEFIPAKEGKTSIKVTGISLDIPGEMNISIKAYEMLSVEYNLPPLDIYLHKIIPSGAGLGGGSSDAAFFLKALNSYFSLSLTEEILEQKALKLGSDCAFFIKNKPVFASGRGEVFEPVQINLTNYFLYLVKPDVFISTVQAYSSVKPKHPEYSLKDLVHIPVSDWKQFVMNDFENNIFPQFPLLQGIKEELYKMGALYSSMSGSGSSIFGIFSEKPKKSAAFGNYFTHISAL
ncbi:MAG: 4-(cytidine 5'-diphospho)-2-C-methyl-D-erythritol kinase [Bacteroidales bacterium]